MALFAILIALIIATPTYYHLFTQFNLFDESVERHIHNNPSILEHIYFATGLPFFESVLLEKRNWLNIPPGISLRVVGFGSVAVLTVFFYIFCRPRILRNNITIAFISSLIFAFLPTQFYGYIISATWIFRDSTNFFGILLFGLAMQALLQSKIKAKKIVTPIILTAQLIVVSAQAIPYLSRSITILNDETISNKLSTLESEIFINKIREIAGNELARAAFSPSLMAERKTLFRDGFVSNVGAFSDLATLNTDARGIATAELYPEKYLMEGQIKASLSNLQDRWFLNTLGVSHVIAPINENVSKHLIKIGAFKSKSFGELAIFQNPEAWQTVTEIKYDGNLPKPKNVKDCRHSGFLCINFQNLDNYTDHKTVKNIIEDYGTITFHLKPANETRNFLINKWYKPHWASHNQGVKVQRIFGSLIGVSVPQGAEKIKLVYWPKMLAGMYAISVSVMLLCLVSVCFILSRRGTRVI